MIIRPGIFLNGGLNVPVFMCLGLYFQEIMLGFHSEPVETPVCVTSIFPAVLRLDVLSDRMEDLAVTKRLLACSLSALKAVGCKGVHVELSVGDKCMLEHYRLLGFQTVKTSDTVEDTVYLGRLL